MDDRQCKNTAEPFDEADYRYLADLGRLVVLFLRHVNVNDKELNNTIKRHIARTQHPTLKIRYDDMSFQVKTVQKHKST